LDNNEFQQSNETQVNKAQVNGTQLEAPLTLGEWLITLIILMIPCVNIVMLLVWGFGNGSSVSRKNYCRAALILMVIGVVLSFIFSASIAALFATALNGAY